MSDDAEQDRDRAGRQDYHRPLHREFGQARASQERSRWLVTDNVSPAPLETSFG